MVAIRRGAEQNAEEAPHMAFDMSYHMEGTRLPRPRRRRSGQAMTEFVLVLLAIVLLIVALVEFLPIFLDNLGLLKEVREEAGRQSLASESGTSSADRKSEFGFEFPGILPGLDAVEGHLSEKTYIPAANLALGETVRIPNIAGMTETLHYENRAGTSEFLSGIVAADPATALLNTKGAFMGAGWTAHPIEAHDALMFSLGDRAVAAVHAGYAADGSGLAAITVIASTAGGAM